MESSVLSHPQRLSPWYNDFVPSTIKGNHPSSAVQIKTSVLCSKCEPIRAWLADHWPSLKIVNQTFEQIFNHYDNSQHLEESALGGCHLCTLFWHNFDPKIRHSRASRLADREKLLSEIRNGRQVQITAYNKGASGSVLCPSLLISDSESVRDEPTPLRSSSYFKSNQEGDSPIFLSSIHVSTTSLAAANLAKEWMAECTKSHPKCARGKSSRLPTRLVDVLSLSKVGQVRIVKTHSISSDIQYAALSYCWGLKPTLKLTMPTCETLTSGVAIESLPRTIQDAINFTRNINLEWLWIDSLCIFQDLKEDWSREALTMREVYENSFITVAALGASSSEEGLFALRDPLLYSPCFLFQTKQGENIYGGQNSSIRVVLDDWPLHQRGWVAQERILPSRTLNFGPYLIWQCQEKTIDEYNVIAGSRYKGGFGMTGQFYDFVKSGGIHSMSSIERDEAILSMWNELVGLYSQGTLTVKTDRLVAISGIIDAIQRRTGWTNLAGLWEPFLWRQLLWEKSFGPSRELTDLLPSWSWIAINGGVIWSGDEPSEGFFLNSVAHVKRTDNVTPSNMDKNSTSDTRMALQVSCMPAKIGTPYSLQTKALKSPEERLGADLVDWPLAGKGIYQPDLLSMNRQPDLFLPIGAGFWNDINLEVYGLAVSPSASCKGAFERVGFFTFALMVRRIKFSKTIITHFSTS